MPDAETLLRMARAFEVRPEAKCRAFWEIGRVWVEWRGTTPEGGEAWCISDGSATLARDGHWEHEPLPSARDADYLARTRWPSAAEAIAFAQGFLAEHPTGRLPEDLPEAAAATSARLRAEG